MNNALQHHGILGMKWGIRRTPEELGHKTSKGKSNAEDPSEKKSTRKPHKRVSAMSDEELREHIARLNMEEQYENLQARKKNRNTSVLRKMIGDAFQSLGKKGFDFAIDWAAKKIFDKEDPNAVLKKEIDELSLLDRRDELLSKKENRNDNLKREVDRLGLEDRKAELLGKKYDRDNPKPSFDIDKWRDIDVSGMSYETIQNVSKWYTNAKLIVENRQKLQSASKPSAEVIDDAI